MDDAPGAIPKIPSYKNRAEVEILYSWRSSSMKLVQRTIMLVHAHARCNQPARGVHICILLRAALGLL